MTKYILTYFAGVITTPIVWYFVIKSTSRNIARGSVEGYY